MADALLEVRPVSGSRSVPAMSDSDSTEPCTIVAANWELKAPAAAPAASGAALALSRTPCSVSFTNPFCTCGARAHEVWVG